MKTFFSAVLACSLFLALPAREAWSQVKLACIGNSITAAYGYPDSLRKLLGTGYTVENDGVSSTTAIRRGSYPYWTKGKLANVFAFKPDWITIKLGTNDSRPDFWSLYSGEFKRDYLALIDTLNTMAKKPKIWIVIPAPCWRTEENRPNDGNLLKILPILQQIAAERGLPLIDVRTPLLKFEAYFKPDGIHPNAAGSDTIAHVIYRALMSTTTALREKGAPPGRPMASLFGQAGYRGPAYFLAGGPAIPPWGPTVPGAAYSLKAFDLKGAASGHGSAVSASDLQAFDRKTAGRGGVSIIRIRREPALP